MLMRAAGALLIGSLVTAPSTATEPPEWADLAIAEHVELGDYAGLLDARQLAALIGAGEHLFAARFTQADGVGRPMATQAIVPTLRRRPARTAFSRTAGLDANACASCHNVPVIGGAGDFSANVFVSEGFTHTEFDSTDPQFSNERNTNHLFGAGLIELLAREMTVQLQGTRAQALRAARTSRTRQTVHLQAKGVSFGTLAVHADGRVNTRGVEGVDADLVVRPFGHKGVMTSLRQFTVNALNHHHGMQAVERFGARWTGSTDFDQDGLTDEISSGDVSALVAWQAALPPPRVAMDLSPAWQAAARRGGEHFDAAGCAACHRRSLPLESMRFNDPGPLDAAGTLRTNESAGATQVAYDLAGQAWATTLERDAKGRVLVPLFGDLKRHKMTDSRVNAFGNELLSQRFVERNVFITSELWGAGSTAPYGHRGDMTTLAEAIDAHGGASRGARDAYLRLDEAARSDINAFLKSLVIAPDAR